MVDLGADGREAFARICAHAFAENRTVAEVAADIVANRLQLPPADQ
jgi:AmiR/NasT family two-component response regulator